MAGASNAGWRALCARSAVFRPQIVNTELAPPAFRFPLSTQHSAPVLRSPAAPGLAAPVGVEYTSSIVGERHGGRFELRPAVEVLARSLLVKKIEAVIRHYKLEDVKNALTAVGVLGMTVAEVRGFGRQRGHKEMYRGAEYSVDFLPKVKLEVVVADDAVRDVVDTIIRVARTGQIGDGKIFVSDLAEVVRIRTGETREEAL